MFDWMRFKMSLRACRVQRGFTQKEVADFMGSSEKSVVDWENGYSSPTMDKAQKLAELYEIPFEHMDFSKDGNKVPSKEERMVILARKLEPDTVTIPEEVSEDE